VQPPLDVGFYLTCDHPSCLGRRLDPRMFHGAFSSRSTSDHNQQPASSKLNRLLADRMPYDYPEWLRATYGGSSATGVAQAVASVKQPYAWSPYRGPSCFINQASEMYRS